MKITNIKTDVRYDIVIRITKKNFPNPSNIDRYTTKLCKYLGIANRFSYEDLGRYSLPIYDVTEAKKKTLLNKLTQLNDILIREVKIFEK